MYEQFIGDFTYRDSASRQVQFIYMTVRETASRPSTGHKCAETIYVHNEGCQSDLSGVYTCHAENYDRRIQTQEFPSVGLHFPNAKILVVIVKCEIPNK